MTGLELKALERAVTLKAALLDRVRPMPVRAWPRHVRGFLSDLAAMGLQDDHARFVLLATLIEELRLIASRSQEGAAELAWAGSDTGADAGPGDLHARCEQAMRRLGRLRPTKMGGDDRERGAACAARIARLIDERYMERLTLASLAASVREPRAWMAATFRRQTGTTIHAYLTRVRVDRAADSLRLGEKVEAVMLAVGYHSKRSFYRQFQSLTGLTPGAYRDAARLRRTGRAAG